MLPLSDRVSLGNWDDLRHRCREILEHCIYPDKDWFRLPWAQPPRRTFFYCRQHGSGAGANYVATHSPRLDRSVELKMNSTITVSARGIWIPTRTNAEKLEDLVKEVADHVTEMALAAGGESFEPSRLRAEPIAMSATSAAPLEISQWIGPKF